MIITARGDSLVLVEQNEHGRIAGELCAAWGGEHVDRPEPAESARLAAALHDDGWRIPDAEPRFNAAQARPLHFLEIDLAEHADVYRPGVEHVLSLDPYAGLLVSMHWTGLYTARWGAVPRSVFASGDSELGRALATVVDGEERRWIELKRTLAAGERRSDFEMRLWHNYETLQAQDVLSLYACTAVLAPAGPDEERAPVTATLASLEHRPGVRTIAGVPTRPGGPRLELALTSVADGVVEVDPFPFAGDSLTVHVAARAIERRPYASAAHAREAYAAARGLTIDCELRRAA